MRKTKRRWNKCVRCGLLVFSETNTIGNHVCPEKIHIEKEAELDERMEEEMLTWEFDQKLFWRSKDVKFMEYLAKKGKI